ncbi:holin [Streptomyces pacificus]|uniref:Holin n=1 Tax=Streptomyces pacificus TaxID=2705029 RepID=A0A6A0AMY0_9ACTN|nr:holin [Streptomyces pacificus]
MCSRPGCGEFTDQGGRCDGCRSEAEQRRGTARQRGYDREHEQRFRPGVLAKNPTCVLCGQRPSVHADHHPLSRRELVQQGLDPHDPRRGRGLCGPCHSSETAKAQPGGWHQRQEGCRGE